VGAIGVLVTSGKDKGLCRQLHGFQLPMKPLDYCDML
jgi:hypothetical protein